MATKRPAKIAGRKKIAQGKACTTDACDGLMTPVKFVRWSKASGMFWLCPKCENEIPTRA